MLIFLFYKMTSLSSCLPFLIIMAFNYWFQRIENRILCSFSQMNSIVFLWNIKTIVPLVQSWLPILIFQKKICYTPKNLWSFHFFFFQTHFSRIRNEKFPVDCEGLRSKFLAVFDILIFFHIVAHKGSFAPSHSSIYT